MNGKKFSHLAVGGMLVLIVSGIVLANGFSYTLEATNSTEFCTSCHSMQWVKAEWQQSAHYSNSAGVRAECRDCHVPHETLPKLQAKLLAAKDVWHEIMGTIDTEKKFKADRWRMANVVWERMMARDSQECRNCHTQEAMDMEAQDSFAAKKHKKAFAKGETCIQCHHGVAHREPVEPLDLGSAH